MILTSWGAVPPAKVAGMSARVDAVVVSYNSALTLRGCVQALVAGDGVRVVVVDNASSDGGIETLEDLPVAIVRLKRNGGFAHGCNHGWRAGSAPYVLFVNPDARLDARSLSLLVDALEQDPRAGIAAPRILDEDGNLDFSMRRFPRLRSTYAQGLFLHRLFPHASWADEVVRDSGAYLRPASPEWVSGACFLIRRTLLEELGGLEEHFFMYCEDKDLCRRVHDRGSTISFVPEAVAVHAGGASAPRSTLLPVLAASRALYARKNETFAVSVLARGGLILGALTHALAGRGGPAARKGHARAAAALLKPSLARRSSH